MNSVTGLTFRINYFTLTSEVEQMNESARFSVNHLPIGSLAVFVDHVVGVSTSHSSVRAPEIRPMVRVSVGNQTSVTSIQERTGSPIYEDPLNFLLYNPQLEDILVEMVDMYSAMETTYIYMIRSSKSKHDDSIDWVELSRKGSVHRRTTSRSGRFCDHLTWPRRGTISWRDI